MTAEQYWELHKKEVLAELNDTGNEDELLAVYHRFWESLKVHVLSCFEHEIGSLFRHLPYPQGS